MNFCGGVSPIQGFLLDNGVFTPIEFPGTSGTAPFSINDRGQIVGVGLLQCKVLSGPWIDAHTRRENAAPRELAALLPALAGYFQGVPIVSPTAIKKYGNEWNRYPVGTGAFTYNPEQYKPDELVVLEKNPNYFKKGLPYVDRVEIAGSGRKQNEPESPWFECRSSARQAAGSEA